MDKQACIQLYNIAKKVDANFIMRVGRGCVVTKPQFLNKYEIELETDIETFVMENDIVQCIISDSNFDKIKSLEKEIINVANVEIKNKHKSLIDENSPKNGDIYYGIANTDSSKGNSISVFCKMLNIDPKDTIGIGDDYNDISMFETVGYSVVMENASDKVKEYANEITESNNNDGVAIFLEKFNNIHSALIK